MTIYNKVDNMAYIYKITSPSKRVYIGSTVNIKSRKRNYIGLRCKQQRKLYYSLLKYGWEQHNFSIIEEVEFELMYIKERFYQEKYNSVEEGLNCMYVETVNKPRVIGKEARKKMSLNSGARNKSTEWQAKITASLKGRVVAEETRKKISMTKLGKKESAETREKKRLSALGRKHSPETIEKIRKGQKDKKVFSKKITQLTLEGEVIKVWKNVEEVYNELGYSKPYIRDAARGLYKHKAKGFLWKYE